jgi:hypothetical protein
MSGIEYQHPETALPTMQRHVCKHAPECSRLQLAARRCCLQGFSMALAGNTLLLTYFIGRQESSAALIQALGVGSNYALLIQVGCGAQLSSSGSDSCGVIC